MALWNVKIVEKDVRIDRRWRRATVDDHGQRRRCPACGCCFPRGGLTGRFHAMGQPRAALVPHGFCHNGNSHLSISRTGSSATAEACERTFRRWSCRCPPPVQARDHDPRSSACAVAAGSSPSRNRTTQPVRRIDSVIRQQDPTVAIRCVVCNVSLVIDHGHTSCAQGAADLTVHLLRSTPRWCLPW